MESIYAVDRENGLCKNGKIPWYSKRDLNFFMEKTKKNVVIMGKNTYLSLPKGPLKDRLNIVLTKSSEELVTDLSNNTANLLITNDDKIHEYILNNREKYLDKYFFLSSEFKIIFIGGKRIYEQFIPLCKIVWVTYIKQNYECDVFLNYNYSKEFKETIMEENEELKIIKYEKNIVN